VVSHANEQSISMGVIYAASNIFLEVLTQVHAACGLNDNKNVL